MIDESPDYGRSIRPRNPLTTFNINGVYLIAGGVLLNGDAEFFVGDGDDRSVRSAKELGLAHRAGNWYIVDAGKEYELRVSQSIICPTARFVSRGGLIAYTVPPFEDEARLASAGLIPGLGGYIAPEFAKPPLSDLVYEADFAATEQLPTDLVREIISYYDPSKDYTKLVIPMNNWERSSYSYVNSSEQIVYQVELDGNTGAVSAKGLPLRYYWTGSPSGMGGMPEILNVKILSPDRSRMNKSFPGAVPVAQGEILDLYGLAAILNQFERADPEGYDRIVAAACRPTIQ